MHRTVLASALGVLVLTVSACTGDTPSAGPSATASAGATASATTSAAAQPTATATANYTANTKRVCARVDNLLEGRELDRFAKRVGQLILYKKAKKTARAVAAREGAKQELKNLATAMRRTTSTAQDPALKVAGEQSAAGIAASAADNAFFTNLKTIKDVNTNLTSEMTTWLTPLATHCP